MQISQVKIQAMRSPHVFFISIHERCQCPVTLFMLLLVPSRDVISLSLPDISCILQ
jgi:hypothetical protein